jgi:hypothetical protein
VTGIAADRRDERAGGATAWLGFAGCLIAVFMQMIDVTIVEARSHSLRGEVVVEEPQPA